jgi:hypothetical protein
MLKTTDQKFPIQNKPKDATAHGWRVRNFEMWCDESQQSEFKQPKLGQRQYFQFTPKAKISHQKKYKINISTKAGSPQGRDNEDRSSFKSKD